MRTAPFVILMVLFLMAYGLFIWNSLQQQHATSLLLREEIDLMNPSKFLQLPTQVLKSGPEIKNQLYAHGGFFASATAFFFSPPHMTILKVLQPDVYWQVRKLKIFTALSISTKKILRMFFVSKVLNVSENTNQNLTNKPQQTSSASSVKYPNLLDASTRLSEDIEHDLEEARNKMQANGEELEDDEEEITTTNGNSTSISKDNSTSTKKEEENEDLWAFTGSKKLIPMLENNPVIAAFGFSLTKRHDTDNVNGVSDRLERIKSIEWDAFLSPASVKLCKRTLKRIHRCNSRITTTKIINFSNSFISATPLHNTMNYNQNYSKTATENNETISNLSENNAIQQNSSENNEGSTNSLPNTENSEGKKENLSLFSQTTKSKNFFENKIGNCELQELLMIKQDLSKCRKALVDEMVICHGNPLQTVLENKTKTSLLHKIVYTNILKTLKTRYGGVHPDDWMDLFGKAIWLDSQHQKSAIDFKKALELLQKQPRHTDPQPQTKFMTFVEKWSFGKVIELYKSTFNKQWFSVFLDLKTRKISPEILKLLIHELNKRGIHVFAIGSFVQSEIEGIENVRQEIQIFEENFENLEKNPEKNTEIEEKTSIPDEKQEKKLKISISSKKYSNRVLIPKKLNLFKFFSKKNEETCEFNYLIDFFAENEENSLSKFLEKNFQNFYNKNEKIEKNPQKRIKNFGIGPPAIPIKLFHSHGDIQYAIFVEKSIKSGDYLMFNLGSLISYKSLAFSKTKQNSYKIRQEEIELLKNLKKQIGFHLGGYCQEYDIDEKALKMLIEVTNSESSGLFDFGFAYGNVNGVLVADIIPRLLDGTTGMDSQQFVAKKWNFELNLKNSEKNQKN